MDVETTVLVMFAGGVVAAALLIFLIVRGQLRARHIETNRRAEPDQAPEQPPAPSNPEPLSDAAAKFIDLVKSEH